MDQMKKVGWKVCGVKHKKVEQALGRSLRNLFEQLAGVFRQLRCVYCDKNFWIK